MNESVNESVNDMLTTDLGLSELEELTHWFPLNTLVLCGCTDWLWMTLIWNF